MIPEWVAAEHTIQAAVDAVERMPGHPLLTDAVILLGQARNKVADFVELPVEIPTRPDTPQTREEDRQAERDLADELSKG